MTERDKFQRAFSPVRASNELLTDTVNKAAREQKPKRVYSGARRRVLTAAVIAALILVLAPCAYAVGEYLNSPEAAWKTTVSEIEKLKELGVLSPEVQLAESAFSIIECQESAYSNYVSDNYWFGRVFRHRYNVSSSTEKYYLNLDVDTMTGKITKLSIEANADESDTLIETALPDGTSISSADNFDDIIRTDMTLETFCELLAQYWGFDGYTISGTTDEFYKYNTEPPSGNTPMGDFADLPYITVYFDGDQSDVPMYIELARYEDGVYFTVGTNHSIG